jgi:K+-sensing histidine kinase KdpD
MEEFDMAELCAEVLERAKFMPERLPSHTVELDSAGPVVGTWDRARFDRALTNLLSNAFNYLRRGGDIRIEVRQIEDRARVIVSGYYRPEEHVAPEEVRAEAVAELQRQARESLMAGLVITSQTVERHNSSLNIDADLDGVTYTLSLPLVQPVA